MQNSMVTFTFLFSTENVLLKDKFGPKNQNGQFKLKFDSETNFNI